MVVFRTDQGMRDLVQQGVENLLVIDGECVGSGKPDEFVLVIANSSALLRGVPRKIPVGQFVPVQFGPCPVGDFGEPGLSCFKGLAGPGITGKEDGVGNPPGLVVFPANLCGTGIAAGDGSGGHAVPFPEPYGIPGGPACCLFGRGSFLCAPPGDVAGQGKRQKRQYAVHFCGSLSQVCGWWLENYTDNCPPIINCMTLPYNCAGICSGDGPGRTDSRGGRARTHLPLCPDGSQIVTTDPYLRPAARKDASDISVS